MNKSTIYIGIDFSLKSPAVCIFKNGSYTWLSHCSKVEKPKKETLIQEEVASLKDVDMTYHGKLEQGTDYSSNDYADLINYRNHADTLLNLILEDLKDIDFSKTFFRIGFEGYSFNSFTRSDNIINIVAATSIMKDRILSHLKWKDSHSIDIIAPINIKKFAGYAKFDKVDMFDVFTSRYNHIREKWEEAIQKDHEKKVSKGKPSVFKWDWQDDRLESGFYSYCLDYEINRAVKKPKVPKPIDDMIDAYFVCCFLREKYLNKG